MYPVLFASFREDFSSYLVSVKVNESFVVVSSRAKVRPLYTSVIFDISKVANQSSWKHTGALHTSAALLSEAILRFNTIILGRY